MQKYSAKRPALLVVTMLISAMTVLSGSLSGAQPPASPETPVSLMPLPAKMTFGSGEFVVNNGFGIALAGYQEPRLERAKQRFLDVLSRETGIPLWREAVLNQPQFFIETAGPSDAVQHLEEDESYHLEVTAEAVHLRAANPLGVMHGLQTFLQLVRVTPQGFSAPAVTIDDKPRFPWRGLMIDVSRHFMPIDVIERNLDGMEAVKLNVFHWHLSDDQGFRVESRRFPLLQKKGSDGLYYTQDQVREVIAYARDRGIRVVPEFDMPAHTSAWFAGYPDLASGKGPYRLERQWGVFDPTMDPTRESTYQFLDPFLGEMTALFPDAYFHIGGDECTGKEWEANPRIQAFMRAHGLRDTNALQAYFTARVQKIVAGYGKVMEGWDEVLQPGTPTQVIIQSWRGHASLAAAVRRGYGGLLSFGYYIDLNQSAAEHYAVDPLAHDAASLSPEQQKNILGGEATMWSEYVTPENIDSRIWPRTAAIAERLWSPQSVQDVPSMYARLAVISQKLNYRGLTHNSSYPRMLRRMSGEAEIGPLQVLGDVMQPPKFYVRRKLAQYDAFTPLNHLVDAIPPESDTARHFLDLVHVIVAGKPTQQDWEDARRWLTLWRNNDAQLQPMLAQSKLTEELGPVSASLRQVSITGLDALDCLQQQHCPTGLWRSRQLAFLKQAAQPRAVLVDMVAPAVAKLVEATPAR